MSGGDDSWLLGSSRMCASPPDMDQPIRSGAATLHETPVLHTLGAVGTVVHYL